MSIISKNKCPVCGRHEWRAMEITKAGIEYRMNDPLIAVVDFAFGDPEEADECTNCKTVVV